MIPGVISLTMINGCRHLKILELILDFTIYENAMKMKCSRGISLILVLRKILGKEWDKAMKGEVTPNCRMQCSGCGAARWGGGVCVEGQELNFKIRMYEIYRTSGCYAFLSKSDAAGRHTDRVQRRIQSAYDYVICSATGNRSLYQ